MPGELPDALQSLNLLERGILLGALMTDERAPACLEGLAAPLAGRCGAALDRLNAAERSERHAAIARLTRDVAPSPALTRPDAVHPSWVGGADLTRLPPALFQRLIWSLLVKLPYPLAAGQPADGSAELLTWPVTRLHVALRRLALLALAHAARRAGTREPQTLGLFDQGLSPADQAWFQVAAEVSPVMTEEIWAFIESRWLSAAGLARSVRGQSDWALLAFGAAFALEALEPSARGRLALGLPAELGRSLAAEDPLQTGCSALVRLLFAADRWDCEGAGGS